MIVYTADFGNYDGAWRGARERYNENNDPLHTEGLTNKMRGKMYKMTAMGGERLWIDSSIEILDMNGLRRLASWERDITLFRHPARKTVEEEAACVRTLELDTEENIDKALEEYGDSKAGGKLYKGAIFFYKDTAEPFLNIWRELVFRTSGRDQLTMPLALERSGCSFLVLDLNVWDNPYFVMHPHK